MRKKKKTYFKKLLYLSLIKNLQIERRMTENYLVGFCLIKKNFADPLIFFQNKEKKSGTKTEEVQI